MLWPSTRLGVLAMTALVAAGCRSDKRDPPVETDTLNNTSVMADSSSSVGDDDDGSTSLSGSTGGAGTTSGGVDDDASTTTGGPADCSSFATPCEDGLFCVAPYADNERGQFVCETQCIEIRDESKWCFDASACCDVDAECTSRGYCEVPGSDTSGSTGAG